MRAWVSMGARYHHQLSSVSRQNMPNSSFVTLRSLIDLMMSLGVEFFGSVEEPKRWRAMARGACDWRSATLSQWARDWARKKSTAFWCWAATGLSLRKKLRP